MNHAYWPNGKLFPLAIRLIYVITAAGETCFRQLTSKVKLSDLWKSESSKNKLNVDPQKWKRPDGLPSSLYWLRGQVTLPPRIYLLLITLGLGGLMKTKHLPA